MLASALPDPDISLTGATGSWNWLIKEGRIIGDARFAALYGLRGDASANGISPLTFFSNIHPDDRARIRLAVGGMLRGAEVFSKEYRVIVGDGTTRWVHARGRCYLDADGEPDRFSGAIVDITDQKRAEQLLQVAQTAGGVGTFEYVSGFGTAAVSTQFCRLLGLQPATDLPMHTINAVVDERDQPIVDHVPPDRPGPADKTEFRITRPDTGETRWLTRRGEYHYDVETGGLRFTGVVYDITESKRTEEQLRSLNETLEQRVEERTRERDGLWKLSQDLLGICNADGVWLSINPAWTRVLGWRTSEIVGKTLTWMEHPEDHRPSSVIATGVLNRLREKSGSYRSFSWTAVQQEGLLYCVARDVTEELHREESLAKAEEQLRQSQKMEAVGQLTGGIAHDFNNMLTGVISAFDLIRRRLAGGRSDGVDRLIEAGTASAHRAATLVHSLLAFARRQSLDIKAQDVNCQVVGLGEILRRTLGESIRIHTQLQDDLWPALTDANQLDNALLNLAINARDAMPEGGHLTIETRNEVLTANDARRLEGATAGEFVAIAVSDTGCGMPADVVAKVFEPFFTTKPLGQGTGLGLSMIYGFVKQSGGHIYIKSEVGKGTTVTMYLRKAERPQELSPARSQADVPVGRGETVLLVEDDQSVRLLVTEVLEELEYRLIEASNAAEAIPLLKSDQRIDLLITDVGLPNIDGRQLADIARSSRPDLKVLFVTGYAAKAAVQSHFLAPGMEMMTKPFDLDALAAKIRQLIDG